jgi:hypothetical protein
MGLILSIEPKGVQGCVCLETHGPIASRGAVGGCSESKISMDLPPPFGAALSSTSPPDEQVMTAGKESLSINRGL